MCLLETHTNHQNNNSKIYCWLKGKTCYYNRKLLHILIMRNLYSTRARNSFLSLLNDSLSLSLSLSLIVSSCREGSEVRKGKEASEEQTTKENRQKHKQMHVYKYHAKDIQFIHFQNSSSFTNLHVMMWILVWPFLTRMTWMNADLISVFLTRMYVRT